MDNGRRRSKARTSVQAAGAVAAPARMASAAARLAVRAVAGGAGNVLKQAADRGVENVFYGTHHDLFEGAAQSFLTGAAIAGAIGAATDRMGSLKRSTGPNKLPGINKFEGSFKLRAFARIRQVLEPKPTNPWAGLNTQIVKTGIRAFLKPALNIGWGQVKDAYMK
ncbi:hypothetical protein NOF04DRAFT_14264 [Fusarium oxysporum II5]|uniref:Uncharacterized protein n=2 Tax=Fusarium oxysporum species complex TaxID=171631 RepID=X0IVA9_FUSO5|nr:uncharacterized protein FOIG_14043 [Fusarium odoratissimum NRRL 54006]EXL92868.1 hypothetical protein FOIG_14043 [Fusarium odoratissimum NRRL 54006]KAK2123096.1 hypothetical protein NOF04DRAFT_14264 [Fusarium oxysporum II5]